MLYVWLFGEGFYTILHPTTLVLITEEFYLILCCGCSEVNLIVASSSSRPISVSSLLWLLFRPAAIPFAERSLELSPSRAVESLRQADCGVISPGRVVRFSFSRTSPSLGFLTDSQGEIRRTHIGTRCTICAYLVYSYLPFHGSQGIRQTAFRLHHRPRGSVGWTAPNASCLPRVDVELVDGSRRAQCSVARW
jgi:hypothetical protein